MREQITPPAQIDTPKTVQSNQSNPAKLLLSSLGIPTKPDIPQIDPSEEVPDKIPIKDTKPQKSVANITGNAKPTRAVRTGNVAKGTNRQTPKPTNKPIPAPTNKQTPTSTKPLPTATKPKSSREQMPQVDTGKFDRTFPQTHKTFDNKCLKTETTSDPEAEVWDDIVGGYIKYAKTSSKRKHADTTPQKIAPKKPESVHPTTPKRDLNKSQPPLPLSVPKPTLPADPPGSPPPKSPKQILPPSIIPSLPKQIVISPLKPAAANPGVTKSKSHQYSTKKKAGTTPLRSQQNWAQAEVSPPKTPIAVLYRYALDFR